MVKQKEERGKEDSKKSEDGAITFRGHYISAIGRRKTAVALVRIYKKGSGLILINGQKINDYFSLDKTNFIKQPLKLAGLLRDLNILVKVKGGGKSGQAEAVRHAVSRGLVLLDRELKPLLRSKKLLTRDARIKERKKPGLKKARRAPQWAKR